MRNNNHESSKETSIPQKEVSAFIGKGGMNIQALQRKTRTQIRLDEDSENNFEPKIIYAGSGL